jgi:RNA polymerase sigma-70 factor (ECF subfamily)
MSAGPPTRPSLLVRLRDHRDRLAWAEFVELYAPVVFGFARKQGLQDADAADLTQDVFRSVARAMGRFDYRPGEGGFRVWLFQVARNHLRSFLRRAVRQARFAGTDADSLALDELPAAEELLEDIWEREWRREVFAQACRVVRPQVRPATWEAFHRTAVRGEPGADVAEDLGISLAAVYLARGRVFARLREYVENLERE